MGLEAGKIRSSAFKTGPVTRRKRRRFIQEKKFGISVGGHRFSFSSLIFKLAGYPGAPCAGSDDGSKRINAILQHPDLFLVYFCLSPNDHAGESLWKSKII